MLIKASLPINSFVLIKAQVLIKASVILKASVLIKASGDKTSERRLGWDLYRPDGFPIGLLLEVVQHGVGLQPVVLLLRLIPAVTIGPASLHLLLGPGVVVVLRELLD